MLRFIRVTFVSCVAVVSIGLGLAWAVTTVQNDALGNKSDSAWVSGSGSMIALLKNIANGIAGAIPSCGSLGSCPTIGGTFPVANSIGGATPVHYLSAASTNSTNVKNAAGTLYSITVINNTSTAADLRIYDTASAPTCSSATGVVANYGIQANTTSAGVSPNLGPVGLVFATGISFCLTAYDGTDTNNSASVTGIQINLAYK